MANNMNEMQDKKVDIWNRENVLKRIDELYHEFQKSVIMMIGVNDFSSVNYIHGYQFADSVLEEFEKQMQQNLPQDSQIYRMYGVKFVLCIPDVSKEETEVIYQGIQKLAREGMQVGDEVAPLYISAGAVALDDYNINQQEMLFCAEYALQQSKKVNHGELIFLEGIEMEARHKQLEIYEAIHHAINQQCEGFYMCYQPIVDAKTGKIKGAESLLRWKNEALGEVPPGRFLSWLEGDPCFFELGKWILKRALQDGINMLAVQPDFLLTVNVAYSQLERNSFRESLLEILKETEFPAKNLCLELTAQTKDVDFEFLKKEVEFLHVNEIKVALDDFGTGFASMDLLCEIPVEIVKVDQSFVLRILHKKVNQMAVEMITDFSSKLGLDVCLEGVENQEIRDFVSRYAVKYHQGYLYARPEPARSILLRMEAENEQ